MSGVEQKEAHVDAASDCKEGISELPPHLRLSTRFFAGGLGCVFLLGAVAVWSASAGFLLLLFGIPLLSAALLLGGVVLMVRGVGVARRGTGVRDRVIGALAVPAMMFVTAALAWPSLATGSFAGDWTHLMVHRSHYETIIAAARAARPTPDRNGLLQQDRGVTYIVDAGPPVRVAFNPEGILDNWSGIVFDPTGAVMEADGFDPATGKFAAPDRVTKLFGGDLVGCRRLWASYYTCSFT